MKSEANFQKCSQNKMHWLTVTRPKQRKLPRHYTPAHSAMGIILNRRLSLIQMSVNRPGYLLPIRTKQKQTWTHKWRADRSNIDNGKPNENSGTVCRRNPSPDSQGLFFPGFPRLGHRVLVSECNVNENRRGRKWGQQNTWDPSRCCLINQHQFSHYLWHRKIHFLLLKKSVTLFSKKVNFLDRKYTARERMKTSKFQMAIYRLKKRDCVVRQHPKLMSSASSPWQTLSH